jgi:hypothetical protein
MRLFKHPSIDSGRIHFESETYDVVAGVVECPDAIGLGADWPMPTAEERAAYEQAVAGEPKGDDAEPPKADKKKRDKKGDDAE